jgi:hypothetical protein
VERGEWQGDTCPLLHVFDSCPNLIEYLPALPYNRADGTRPEDADTHYEHDHLPDALRYLVMGLGASTLIHSGSKKEKAIDGAPFASPLTPQIELTTERAMARNPLLAARMRQSWR